MLNTFRSARIAQERKMARRRRRMSRKKSKRLFGRTAGRTHKKNTRSRPMRGGYRI